jgi:hypothetical protein
MAKSRIDQNLDNGKYIPFLNAYYELAEKLEKGLD